MAIEETIMNKITCKYCGSPAVVKYGTYKSVQRYWCKSCKRKFKADDSPFHMQIPASQITSALSMYYEGMSLNAIRRHFQQEYGTMPSSSTVYEWIEKYTPIAIKAFRDYHPEVGNVWIADETVLKIDGQNVWMYDIIDEKTRFLLATRITTSRTIKDAQALMEKAARRAGIKPKMVITDKQNSYLDGIELAYGADTEHVQSSPFAPTDDTQRIERFHGTLKQRTKVMRGLKNIESANEFTDGWLVHYNFFRPHESLKDKTPAEVARIDYPVKNWADVIKQLSPATMPEVSKAAQFRDRTPRTKLSEVKGAGRPRKRKRVRIAPPRPIITEKRVRIS